MISVKSLTKHYGKVKAVQNMSFEVGRGEIVGLLGHNGAGKTTVMKIITGFLEPTEGTVTVGGVDVLQDRVGVQKQIGYMPENAPIYSEMLVQEYLLMMAELRGIPQGKRLAAVAEAARSTGLEKWMVRPIDTLSKGFRQRVGLCQAILHKPDVLILDEPTNGLDPVQIVEIRNLIKRLAKDSTVILSTHILPEIEAVCDRVIILIDGELTEDASLTKLLTSNRVLLSVSKDAAEVSGKLKRISGVRSVLQKGPDPTRDGFVHWFVDCEDGAQPVPEIIRTAHDAGWEVGSVAPQTPSLEQVFQQLMEQHIDRRKAASKGEVAA